MTQLQFGAAYRANFRHTVKFLLAKGTAYDAAEDLAQAAWTRGWERLKQLRNEEHLATWVNTIAFNLFRRALRKNKRELPLESDLSGGRGIDFVALDVGKLLGRCSASQRLLLLWQMQGLNTNEIAQSVGITAAAVRVRLTRARHAARVLLQTAA